MRFVSHGYLDGLFLEGEGVDYPDPSCSPRQHSHAVCLVLPPRLTKVIGPVRTGAGGRDVDEPTHGYIGDGAASDGVHMGLHLRAIGRGSFV